VGASWADPGATASDACEGNLTGSIQFTGTVNPSVTGLYAPPHGGLYGNAGNGGNGGNGGGIYSAGPLSLTDCTFATNTAGSGCGGKSSEFGRDSAGGNGGHGGGVYSLGVITLSSCTFSGDMAGFWRALYFHDQRRRLRLSKKDRAKIFRLLHRIFRETIRIMSNRTHQQLAAAWRQTVESWLAGQGLISIRLNRNKKLSSHFPRNWSHN